jgi:charged multivesicular body protein 1
MDYIWSLFGYDKYKTLEDIIFKLKFTKKGLQRDIKKSETRMALEINNVKNDIWKSDIMAAQIHSENAIRQKNQRINYMQFSSKIDALICRLELAVQNGKLTDNMFDIAHGLEYIQNDFSYKNIVEVLGKFDTTFEDFDVMTGMMDTSIKETTSTQIPQEEVIELMKYVADTHSLTIQESFMELDMYENELKTKKKNNNSVEERFNILKNT